MQKTKTLAFGFTMQINPVPEAEEAEQGQNGKDKAGDTEGGGKAASAGGGSGGGGGLYPSMAEDPKLRWAFIRKVYLILAVQSLFTAAVALTFNRVRPIPRFINSFSAVSVGFYCVILFAPFVALFPMLYFRKRHPINMVFLALFTLCQSLLVGYISAILHGLFLLEAAFTTTAVLVSLTLYTFWAARRGHDFAFFVPFLLVSTLVLLIYLLMQICFKTNKIAMSVYGCLATIVFSGFIIYDTDNLIKRHTYDEYTTAAVSLYLDVVNLFMSILGIPAFGI